MTRRATVLGASLVLEHVPDLVRYGSKPTREPGKHDALTSGLAFVRRGGRVPAEPGLHRQHVPSRAVGRATPLVGSPPRRPLRRRPLRRAHGAGHVLRAHGRGGPVRSGPVETRAGPWRASLVLRRRRRGRRRVGARRRRDAASADPAREPDDQGERGARAPAISLRGRASTPRPSRSRSAAEKRRSAIAISAAAGTSPGRWPSTAGWIERAGST